jgi:ketosteroid isomerase-like protein
MEAAMGVKFVILFSTCSMLVGCSRHSENASGSTAAIKSLFDNWKTAFEAKDVDGVMRTYAPGTQLISFDIVPPLQFKGAEAYRKDYSEFFAQFAGPLHVDLRDMQIEAGTDVAFAYGLERLTGKLTNGTPVDMWMRYTEGLRRIDGQWRVVHEHISVPVDLDSGKARLDLKP